MQAVLLRRSFDFAGWFLLEERERERERERFLFRKTIVAFVGCMTWVRDTSTILA
jgi:hypothetical protein